MLVCIDCGEIAVGVACSPGFAETIDLDNSRRWPESQ